MKNYPKYSVSTLLILSMLLLFLLVPGGPIETRDFSNITPLILATFNIFLTSLGVISLLLVYFIIREIRWAFGMSILCGASYLIVYVLDLGKIFPVSPDPMPRLLFIIEILGALVAIPLILLSIFSVALNTAIKSEQMNKTNIISGKLLFVVVLLVFFGVGIVIFATKSAMGV